MSQYRSVLEELRHRARLHKATVAMGTKGIFGTTYEDAVKASTLLKECEKALEVLEAADKPKEPEE